MPSFVSILLREEIKLLKPIMNTFSIATARTLQNKLGSLGSRSVASKVFFKPIFINGFDACFVEPKEAGQNMRRVILYLHGGGYVSGSIEYARAFASVLVADTKKKVLCIAYRLAPEDPFPAAVDDAFAAYEYLLGIGYSANDISLVGESAGGGLIFCLCLLLKQKGMQLPASLVAISPWTDLTFSGESYKKNCKKDPALTEESLRRDAAEYAAGQENNPLVSPIFGDLRSFPPSLIFAGSDELLLDDAKKLADNLNNSGSQCELVIEEGLWHVYVLFKIPEAAKALKKIAAFLE